MRSYIEGVISGREQGFLASCYKIIAGLPAIVYAAVLHGRHLCYRFGIFEQVKLSVPVVSVGNVVCGGTGKTQLVIALATKLMQKRRVAIVSRGYPVYRGKPMQVFATSTPNVCGDEPKLLSLRLPDALVVVGRDRVQAAKHAIAQGAEIIILDDGMQHRRLQRDFEIGIGPSTGAYLPKGRLRDVPSRLKCAHLVLEQTDLATQPVGVFSLQAEAIEIPKRVSLFCGIGNPERFVKTVEQMGCEIVHKHLLADHQNIELKVLKQLAKGVDAVICTEKDWVKLDKNLSLPICWVKCELELIGKHAEWNAALETIGGL